MGQELTQVLCPECGTSGGSAPEESRWQCNTCGNGFFLRRCSACARVSYVDGLHGFRVPWPCTWCGQFNKGFSQNQDPAAASAAELAAELARHGPPARASGPGAGDQAKPSGRAPGAAGPGDRGLSSAAGAGRPGTAHPLPGLGAAPPTPGRPRPGRPRAWRVGLSIALVVACAGAATVLLTAGEPGAVGMAAGPDAMVAGRGSTTRAVQIAVGRVSSIDFQGVPGKLTIVGTGPGQVTLTGQLQAASGTPVVDTRLDRATGVLLVSVQCAPATQCTENLRLAVPGATGTAVRQPGGQVMVTGLAGPLRLTATNVYISASGLRSPELTAVISGGTLNATFAAAPRQVSITLASAQARLHLSAGVPYRVTQQVRSGYIRVAIPQAGSAARTVTARVDSGELELLPS